MVTEAIEAGFLDGICNWKNASRQLHISHLFADDTLVLCKHEENNSGYVRCAPFSFEVTWGSNDQFTTECNSFSCWYSNLESLADLFGFLSKCSFQVHCCLGPYRWEMLKKLAAWNQSFCQRVHRLNVYEKHPFRNAYSLDLCSLPQPLWLLS